MVLQHLYDIAKRAERIARGRGRSGMVELFKQLSPELDRLDANDFPLQMRGRFLEAKLRAREWANKASFTNGVREAEVAALIADVVQSYVGPRGPNPGAGSQATLADSEHPQIAGGPMSPHQHVVITLHGIKTRGSWQKALTENLSAAGFISIPLDFGNFLAIQMMIPLARRWKVEWFRREYSGIKSRYPNAKISIIAHSFGTYIAANAIRNFHTIVTDCVIFCGSIVETTYPWREVVAQSQVRKILNDFGGRDFWARIVVNVVEDAGPSGHTGFRAIEPNLIQRHYPNFDHSDYFDPLFYKSEWIPFLVDRELGPAAISSPLEKNVTFRRNRRLVLYTVGLLIIGVVAWRPILSIYRRLNRQPNPPTQLYPQTQPHRPDPYAITLKRVQVWVRPEQRELQQEATITFELLDRNNNRLGIISYSLVNWNDGAKDVLRDMLLSSVPPKAEAENWQLKIYEPENSNCNCKFRYALHFIYTKGDEGLTAGTAEFDETHKLVWKPT